MSPPSVVRRRRAALAVGVLVLVALVAVVVKACGGGDDAPPRSDAARIAPGNTIVFADLSTDGDRLAVKRASELLKRFDSYDAQRDAILRRLAGAGKDVDAEKDVLPWVGDEAALALTDAGTATAGSLVMIAVTDEARAEKFMASNSKATARGEYKDDEYTEYGSLTVAIKDGWLLIGQSGTIKAGLDGLNDRAPGLDEEALYKRAVDGLPDGRVATVYATEGGLRRLLVPQQGLLGTAAVLFDQPALQSVAVALETGDDNATLTVHSALDAAEKKREGVGKPFSPELLSDVPEDAMVYLGVHGISGPIGRVLSASVGGANAGGLGPVLATLQKELQKSTGGRLERDLLQLFDGEVAFVVLKSVPAPSLSVMARTPDEDATARTLAQLEQPVAKLLRPKGESTPTWSKKDLGDAVTAHTLQLPSGAALSYAVFDGRLVLSTSPDAIKRLKDHDGSLEDADAFKDVTAGRPEEVGSLGFLDFSQLLELGEQTGLNDSRAYLAARDDLQKIRAVGISSTGGEEETTAEIRFSIP